MANGKPGDHPLTDILVHNRPVFSKVADDAIREIDQLGGRREILDRMTWFPQPQLAELEQQLLGAVNRLRKLRHEQGWERPSGG